MCPLGYSVQSLFSADLLASEMLEQCVIKIILAVGYIKCWQGRCPICIFLPVMFLFMKCSFTVTTGRSEAVCTFFWHKLNKEFWLSGSAVGSCALHWNCCFTSHHPTQCQNDVSSQLGNAGSLREA